MAAIVAALIGRIPVFFGAPELAPLVGWAVAAGVFLTWAWPADPERPRLPRERPAPHGLASTHKRDSRA